MQAAEDARQLLLTNIDVQIQLVTGQADFMSQFRDPIPQGEGTVEDVFKFVFQVFAQTLAGVVETADDIIPGANIVLNPEPIGRGDLTISTLLVDVADSIAHAFAVRYNFYDGGYPPIRSVYIF